MNLRGIMSLNNHVKSEYFATIKDESFRKDQMCEQSRKNSQINSTKS